MPSWMPTISESVCSSEARAQLPIRVPFTRAVSRRIFEDPRPLEPKDENAGEYLKGPDWREKLEKRRKKETERE